MREIFAKKYQNITEIAGVSGPEDIIPENTKVIYISRHGDRLEIPEIPENVKAITSIGAYLSADIPRLPEKLEYLALELFPLNIDNPDLWLEAPILPDNLKYLKLMYIKNKEFPKLPSNLKFLEIQNTCITKISEFPDGLETLILRYSPITVLPALPNSLKYLDLSYSNIIELPNIPENLKELGCNEKLKPAFLKGDKDDPLSMVKLAEWRKDKEIAKLKAEIEKLTTHIRCMPDGEDYFKAKEHYENQNQNKN